MTVAFSFVTWKYYDILILSECSEALYFLTCDGCSVLVVLCVSLYGWSSPTGDSFFNKEGTNFAKSPSLRFTSKYFATFGKQCHETISASTEVKCLLLFTPWWGFLSGRGFLRNPLNSRITLRPLNFVPMVPGNWQITATEVRTKHNKSCLLYTSRCV